MGLLIKEIKSKSGDVHFKRWRIISTPWFAIYVHGIYKADEEAHLHDHPWNYISVVLSGFFEERRFDDSNVGGRVVWSNRPFKDTVLGPGCIAKRNAEEFHKIYKLRSKSVYTLFFVGKRRREWGYSTEKGWVDHKTYRKNKNAGH